MDYESLRQYVGKQVRLTLLNGFWYKAKIVSVSKNSITFIEMKGNNVSVSPEQIILIEGVENGG